jgi:hypothetical protein
MGARKRFLLTLAAAAVALLALFFATAEYRYIPQYRIHYIGRPPFAAITWAPAERFIVQSGINIVKDPAVGRPGNVVEFPIAPHIRVSLRLFSIRWFREESRAWESDHPRIARWLGADCRVDSGS